MELSIILRNKLDLLISFLKNNKIIIAFSGGVDSSLLAYLSNQYAKETLLITVRSILNPIEEIEEAKSFAKKYNIPHQEIVVNLLGNEYFVNN